MPRLTLLEIVKDVLNDLDSDDVNSVDDTIEATQVANIVRSCYYEMISNRNWPHLQKLIQLEHSGNINLPTHLQVPENLKELTFFKYEKHKEGDANEVFMQDVRYKYPDDFLRYISGRTTSNVNVEVITDISGTSLLILNNAAPQFWTSFDDRYIVCDSYDKTLDDTLKKSKTQCLAYLDPEFLLVDDFVPDLPTEAFAALVEESKSTASFKIKQYADQKSEQKASRQQRWLARKAWRAHGGVRYYSYGRKDRR